MTIRKFIALNSSICLGCACQSTRNGKEDDVQFKPLCLSFTNESSDEYLVKRMRANIPWPGLLMFTRVDVGRSLVIEGNTDAIFFYPLFMKPVVAERCMPKINHVLLPNEAILIDFHYNGYVPPHYLAGCSFELSVQFEMRYK